MFTEYLVLALLSLAPLAAAPGDSKSEMPAILQNPAWEHPFWVSAEAAFDERGELVERLFHEVCVQTINKMMKQPIIDGCIRVDEAYHEFVGVQPRGTLERAMETADLILYGKIVDQSVGFDVGFPATLFRLENVQVGKGSSPLTEAFFAWPIAEFNVAGKKICRTDRNHAPLPAIGDEVVAFIKKTEPPEFPKLHLESPADILIIRRGQQVEYPEQMRRGAEDRGAALEMNREALLRELGLWLKVQP